VDACGSLCARIKQTTWNADLMTFATAKTNVKGWRYCALLDNDKEVVKPANGNNKTAAQSVKEIEDIINSLPNGQYYLAVRNSPAAKYTHFPFIIGKAQGSNLADEHATSADQYNTDLYAENVRLAVRNKELETLNKILEEKNAEYLQTIDELEQELADSAETQMAEPQSSVLETILMTALPTIMEKITANAPEGTVDEIPNDSTNAGSPGNPV